jgi:hypothetical protein
MVDRNEADELIQHLLTVAGSIMEDAAGRMIVADSDLPSARAALLVTLAQDLRALGEAAKVVDEQADGRPVSGTD